jgi:hypothetical protein
VRATLLAGCGLLGVASCTTKSASKVTLVDSHEIDADPCTSPHEECNVLVQAGCASGEKCTWIHAQDASGICGFAGCTANGSVELGQACAFGTPTPVGWDDCARGLVCETGVCKLICDQSGGTPTCPAGSACVTHDDVFGRAGQPKEAGTCD